MVVVETFLTLPRGFKTSNLFCFVRCCQITTANSYDEMDVVGHYNMIVKSAIIVEFRQPYNSIFDFLTYHGIMHHTIFYAPEIAIFLLATDGDEENALFVGMPIGPKLMPFTHSG